MAAGIDPTEERASPFGCSGGPCREIGPHVESRSTGVIGTPTLDWTVLNYAYIGQEESDIRASADPSRAYALWVRHPGNPSVSAGSEGMIVAPLRSGEWRIWLVH